MRPPVGCSSPATQRKVVVLPQPEGPSRTTISPAGTSKLTPSTAGLPSANRLTRSLDEKRGCSLTVAVGLVPLLEPRLAQLLELRRNSGTQTLITLGSQPLGKDGGSFIEVMLPSLAIWKAWPSLTEAPVHEQLGGVRGSWTSWECRRRRG